MIFSLTLADCLNDYKVKCEFWIIDITADKVLRCKSTRSTMGAKRRVHQEYFGLAIAIEDQQDLTKEKRQRRI